MHFSDKSPVYITKRFDVLPDNLKIAQDDFENLVKQIRLTENRVAPIIKPFGKVQLLVKELVASSFMAEK